MVENLPQRVGFEAKEVCGQVSPLRKSTITNCSRSHWKGMECDK